MNVFKQIVNVKGIVSPKSFPTQEELNTLPTKKNRIVFDNGQIGEQEAIDYDKLERETVGNIILNVLNNYVQRDRIGGFYCNAIGTIIVSAKQDESVELKEKFKKFLVAALDEATIRYEKQGENDVKKGFYSGWAIAQVKTELGETPIIE
jgi:hypothetical protein